MATRIEFECLSNNKKEKITIQNKLTLHRTRHGGETIQFQNLQQIRVYLTYFVKKIDEAYVYFDDEHREHLGCDKYPVIEDILQLLEVRPPLG